MKMQRDRSRSIWFVAIAIAVGAGAMVAAIYALARRRRQRAADPVRHEQAFPPPVQGLTEEEAAARYTGVDLDALLEAEHKRFQREAIRHNLFTWFNLNLFAIAIIMLLLQNPWSTLGTVFVLVLNVTLNVFQETRTKKRLDELVQTLRPQATVIRGGKLKSIDALNVVQGDILAVGPGDSILVDGELVGDGKIVVNEPANHDPREDQSVKQAGDAVLANSFCIGGRALYRATDAEAGQNIARQYADVEVLPSELTPLQQLIRTILRGLFVVSAIFGIILLANALFANVDLISDEFRNGVAIIIGAAPTSLFFIVIIHYAVGSFRMAEQGALVYNSQSLEAVASISTLCLSRRTLLRGMQVELETIDPPPGVDPLSDSLVQRMLGDYVSSLPTHTATDEMLADAITGTQRSPLETASVLFVQRWSAATFNDPDLRGLFVLGEPDALEPFLLQEKTGVREKVEETVVETEQVARRWIGRLFRRKRDETAQDEAEQDGTEQDAGAGDEANADVRAEAGLENGDDIKAEAAPEPENLRDDDPQDEDNAATAPRRSYWRNFLKRVRGDDPENDANDDATQEAVEEETPPSDELTMMFAYLPTVVPLHDSAGNPQLPSGLIPLCKIHASVAVRPEAKEMLQAFLDAGVQVKLLSATAPEKTMDMAVEIGFSRETLKTFSGHALAAMNEDEAAGAMREAAIIGDLTPAQKADIVDLLHAQGEYVAMLGNDVSDLPAMRRASLSLALPGSSQAVLMKTDIALLEDSLTILPQILIMGQRVVNGVLDTFKLNLSQVLSQLLLIIALWLFQLQAFPYLPVQGGVISVFTITLPNILLVFWSSPGRMPAERMKRRLLHFTIPAGVTLALLTLGVWYGFIVSGHSVNYARLAVTYALLMAGWARIFFVQPPTPFWVGGDILSGDRRVFAGVLGVASFLGVLLLFPQMQEWLKITWLEPRTDYLLVAVAVIIWVIVVRTVWRLRPLRRYGEVPLHSEENIT